jgi:AraC-like DNA-binding protein
VAYRWELLPEVVEAIERADEARALALLHELLPEIAKSTPGGVSAFRMRCAQCMSACLRGARRTGASSDELLDDHMRALERLGRARTRARAGAELRRYVRRLLRQARPDTRSRIERIVAGIRDDLRQRPQRPRTLAHYAREHGLSVGHLSRSFARIAGRPFGDEARHLRDESARELLERTSLSVGEIARRVGLASASHFIAEFSRRHGRTPAEWRRAHGG